MATQQTQEQVDRTIVAALKRNRTDLDNHATAISSATSTANAAKAAAASAVQTVKANGQTYTASNGTVDLGTIAAGTSATSTPKLLFADDFKSLSFGGQSSGATWTPPYEMNDAGFHDSSGSNWNAGTSKPGGITTLSIDADGLVITATRITAGSVSGIDSSVSWVSNMIALNAAACQLPSTFYLEARIKLANFRGAFPAFWLYNSKQRSDGYQQAELDVVECFGTQASWSSGWHIWHDSTSMAAGQGPIQGNVGDWSGDTLTAWHRYGIAVTPDRIVYYLDGVEKGRIEHDGIYWAGSTTKRTESNRKTVDASGKAVDVPKWFQSASLAPRLNLAVDPNWVSSTDVTHSTSTDPASGADTTMHVDYVAAWDTMPAQAAAVGSGSTFAAPTASAATAATGPTWTVDANGNPVMDTSGTSGTAGNYGVDAYGNPTVSF